MIRAVFAYYYNPETHRKYDFFEKGVQCGSFVMERRDDGQGKLWSVQINEELRGKKLGRKLIRDAINLAKAYGFKELLLDVFKDNPQAQALYRRMGFTLYDKSEGLMGGRLSLT
jgi:ribosomal protein S18 acetylase RimI-like enzyme